MTPEQKAEQRLELFDEIMDPHGSGSVMGLHAIDQPLIESLCDIIEGLTLDLESRNVQREIIREIVKR